AGRGAGDEDSHQGPLPRTLLYLPSAVRCDPGTGHHAHRRRLHQVGSSQMSRHVVLLRRDPSLGLALRALLHGTGRVTELPNIQAWSAMPAEGIDAVVIDLPPSRRKQAIEVVRSRFGGRLVLILDPHDNPAAVTSSHAYVMVQRPFEIVELWHLVRTDPSWGGRPGSHAAELGGQAGPEGRGAREGPETAETGRPAAGPGVAAGRGARAGAGGRRPAGPAGARRAAGNPPRGRRRAARPRRRGRTRDRRRGRRRVAPPRPPRPGTCAA